MYDLNVLQQIAVWAIPILFAVTLHEVAHGWMARLLGDRTAQMMGRLSLNPLKHIDLMGTIIVPLAMKFFTGYIFGWAKPVPVTIQNLRNPKRDMAFVAIAGPASNLLMALGWAMICRLGAYVLQYSEMPGYFLLLTGVAGIFINVILMVLNLLPLPPLDGGRVVTSLLPGPLSWKYSKIEPYGMFILIALLATNVLHYIIWPPVTFFLQVFAMVAGMELGTLRYFLNSLF